MPNFKFKALEDMSIEKQTLKERLERELKAVQEASAAKQSELISEHSAKMEVVSQDHKRLLEAERSTNEERLQQLREVFLFSWLVIQVRVTKPIWKTTEILTSIVK